MENPKEIITDEQISDAWGNADFGQDVDKRDVVANAILKYASGYATGYTILQICKELGLATKNYELTSFGKLYLYAHFSKGLSV